MTSPAVLGGESSTSHTTRSWVYPANPVHGTSKGTSTVSRILMTLQLSDVETIGTSCASTVGKLSVSSSKER
jgi:hypothetical protein